MIAALYVDVGNGPYPQLPGVDCWGLARDATAYAGPWPVVAHPPCGHWGRLSHFCKDDGHTGPIAVAQVRRWGGVLEHPADSQLWRKCSMPAPGWLPDEWGGYTVAVNQCDWGHRAAKATWLYVVGCPVDRLPAVPPPVDRSGLLVVTNEQRKGDPGYRARLPGRERHLTPPAFADWLVAVARQCVRADGQ